MASEAGCRDAKHALSFCYERGLGGVEKDDEQSVKLTRSAAERGLDVSQHRLGVRALPHDEPEAKRWFTAASEQGFPPAQTSLGELQLKAGNVHEAKRLFTVAQEQDDAGATYNLAMMLLDAENDDREEHWSKPLALLRRAARLGSVNAMFKLGQLYEDYDFDSDRIDEDDGVAMNCKKRMNPEDDSNDFCFAVATEYFRMASELGHVDAMYCLGLCLVGEDDVAEVEEAAALFIKAANLGHALAAFQTGLYYYNERGLPHSYESAVFWFRKAAAQEEPSAQFYMGDCYFYGEGVPVDIAAAFKWFTLASDQGHPQSKKMLGDMYTTGDFVEQDYVKAFEFYRDAAQGGNLDPRGELAVCYMEGRGTNANLLLAEEELSCFHNGDVRLVDLLAGVRKMEASARLPTIENESRSLVVNYGGTAAVVADKKLAADTASGAHVKFAVEKAVFNEFLDRGSLQPSLSFSPDRGSLQPSLSFSPDSRKFCLGYGSFLYVWDVNEFRCERIWTSTHSIEAIAFCPVMDDDGTAYTVAVASGQGFVQFWSTRPMKTERILDSGVKQDITCISWSPNGSLLAVSFLKTKFISIIDCKTNEIQRLAVVRYGRGFNSFDWSPDGTKIAVSVGPSICIHEVATGKFLLRIQDPLFEDFNLVSISWSCKGLVAGADYAGRVAIFDSATGRRERNVEIGYQELERLNPAVAFSSQGNFFVTVSAGISKLINLNNDDEILFDLDRFSSPESKRKEEFGSVALSHNGRYCLVGSWPSLKVVLYNLVYDTQEPVEMVGDEWRDRRQRAITFLLCVQRHRQKFGASVIVNKGRVLATVPPFISQKIAFYILSSDIN